MPGGGPGPLGSSLETKMSEPPAGVRMKALGPGSKSKLSVKLPVV